MVCELHNPLEAGNDFRTMKNRKVRIDDFRSNSHPPNQFPPIERIVRFAR